ncbi:DNA-binding response OmpR family regulator [Streptomyces sp. 2333.5]|uniref:response regulator transcription factor n=1 Tax=Streptomyces TaxID=1883 RepID=UPI000897071A|nr:MULTISPECIES: response regulator transcription factor [unclassified Streptomyces]PJJ06038.1 DNA-binding response OmpR family regulator [Streptomyces sp. 2333.5]SEE89064.1 DNA-binding response regulator, OmpR family, contains REC and winged-helix (wHTH) domain [Streptomyces sp. 2314.4]SEF06250.1 DNA-binding response regulator, OmpR family, contains REC and winged-helix (wHTH) domain [Streptomyces sp. 2112.2]
MARIVIVEDDETIGGRLAAALRGAGHDSEWCPDGASALSRAVRGPADLVLLDLGLPDADGFELCRRLRERLPGAVLVVLTARTGEMDVVQALESGADDYLTKPFRLAELQARIAAHLRRAEPGGNQSPLRIRHGTLLIDRAARRCSTPTQEVELRPKEFDLLVRLAESAGQAVSREDLMSDVWDENWFGPTKTLDVHVAALRRKLGDQVRITTLRHFGYRLEPSKER